MSVFRKAGFVHPDAAVSEAAGLRWLAAAAGGARVASVHSVKPGALEIERIVTASATPRAARAFGAALARTHAAGAPA